MKQAPSASKESFGNQFLREKKKTEDMVEVTQLVYN